MSENQEVVVAELEKMRKDIKSQIRAEMKAEEEAAAQIQKEKEEYAKALIEELEKEHQEELKKLTPKKAAPAFNQRVGKYARSAGADEFVHWMKTGDNGNEKVLKWDNMIAEDGKVYEEATTSGRKALQVGADTEGGYLAPEDFYSTIIEKRDQLAWTQNVGINRIQTSLKNVQIPNEAVSMPRFAITAEEGAYSDTDPAFGEVDVTIYKFTRMNKFSEELMDDQAANLTEFYANSLARAWALTESYYIAVGTGSAQPQGVFVGGTAGLTFDSADYPAPAEIPELFYKLGNGYRMDAVWLMNDDTEAFLRGIRDANDFAFDPVGQNVGVRGSWRYETFYGGKPIYTETGVSTGGTGLKTVLIGNFGFYGLAEHTSLAVSRNPYLYQANGQVAFFSKIRWGGAVLQAEAFQYGTQA